MKQVGDVEIHFIGYEPIEHIVTQEEVDEYNRQQSEQEKQAIINELAQLDTQISRVEEDIINTIQISLHTSKQAVIDRKAELRTRLKTL